MQQIIPKISRIRKSARGTGTGKKSHHYGFLETSLIKVQLYIIISSNPRVLEKTSPQNKLVNKIFFVEPSELLIYIEGCTKVYNMNGTKKLNVALKT